MEKMYRDFTVCENCGETCYLGNKYCEDCANKLVAEKEKEKDKISFTVEKLEKVKRQIIEDTVWELTYEDVLGIIDNQIKQLKEMK